MGAGSLDLKRLHSRSYRAARHGGAGGDGICATPGRVRVKFSIQRNSLPRRTLPHSWVALSHVPERTCREH